MPEKSTKGRKKHNTTIEQVGPILETSMTEEAAAEHAQDLQLAHDHERHLETLDANYGSNLPYDKGRIENECRFYLQSSAIAMLEAGKRLILIKEHEKHGNFLESIERIGITAKVAQNMMRASIKFEGPNANTYSHLGQSKLFELMVEDDDDLAALADGGTIAGLTLDQIDKMSVRELKAALREEREKYKLELEASENLISQKDATINKYARDAERIHEWPKIVSSLKLDVSLAAGRFIEQTSALRKLVDRIPKESQEHGLSRGQIATIVESFAADLENLNEHLQSLQNEFNENLSGYLNTPRAAWIDADEQV